MILDPTTLAAMSVVAVGFAAFWSNPKRTLNRFFFSGSIHVGTWLCVLHIAMTAKSPEVGLFWLKATCSIGGWLPLHIWSVQQSIGKSGALPEKSWFRRHGALIITSTLLSIVPFANSFIPPESTADNPIHGPGYFGYIAICFLLYAVIFRDAYKSVRALTGGKQLDLQIWLIGGCVIAVSVLLLMMADGLTKNPFYIRLQPVMILIFYGGTAFAITNHRIFDARQISFLALQKALLIVSVSIVAFVGDWVFTQLLPSPADYLATTTLSLWFALSFNSWLGKKFDFFPEAKEARKAAFAIAERETRLDHLENSFLRVLRGWGNSDVAIIVSGATERSSGLVSEKQDEGDTIKAMQGLRWATPERIVRERTDTEREDVGRFLDKNSLGVLVVAEGPNLAILVGIGIPMSRRPFTYPQVMQLLELASIMGNALERAHVSVKAKRAEQLATVGLLGASLAHEIRNPLVSIKTFVQHLPNHYQDAAFRDKFFKLIGSEVSRIDQLTEELLDLASPRVYTSILIELHPALHTSLHLISAKAADRGVEVITDFQATPDHVFTDPSAAQQVMLNLCFNAIQAVDSSVGDKWVKVSTKNIEQRIELAIADSGPGISPEIRARLFQPFQTTKSTGFGLGLAICSNILAGLDATITVDPTVLGKGATFRVNFPCRAS